VPVPAKNERGRETPERIKQRERKNREGREIGLPKDLCVNLGNCRGLLVK
jgi:hypothetical protein